ncbi:rluC [Symbiodinium natans]|uniref:RluC protein n=1 Tax=Symbiodinium natans TaxID=878477 RepID=A0A812N862_9DINO|nr:rluC [Symbiodinium natans]
MIEPAYLRTMQTRLQRRVIFVVPKSPGTINGLHFNWGCCFTKSDNKKQLGYVFGTLHQEYMRDLTAKISEIACIFQAERTLVMGYSMGGFGAFQLGAMAPDVFDVVVSVAGYGLGTLEPQGEMYDAPQPAARKRFRVFLQQVASRLSLVPVVLAMHAQKDSMSSFRDVSAIIRHVQQVSIARGSDSIVQLFEVPDEMADSDRGRKKKNKSGHHYFNCTLLDDSSDAFFWSKLQGFLQVAGPRMELQTVSLDSIARFGTSSGKPVCVAGVVLGGRHEVDGKVSKAVLALPRLVESSYWAVSLVSFRHKKQFPKKEPRQLLGGNGLLEEVKQDSALQAIQQVVVVPEDGEGWCPALLWYSLGAWGILSKRPIWLRPSPAGVSTRGQSTLSLRPDVSQEGLDVDESPCEAITPAELCKTKLRDGQCFFLDGPPLKRSLKRCLLRGPQEGFAEVRANTTPPSTSVSLSASRARASLRGGLIFRGIRLEFQGLHLRGARLQMYDTERGGLGTGSRTRQRDGGAMWAGKGGLKVADSQVYVNSSTAKAGGAIFVASRGQLLLTNHSKLVTENTHAMLSGGSIYARNFRMENRSALQVRKSSGKDGGAIAADMFVVRKGSKVNISEAESHRFGGAVSSARRLVVQYGSEVKITNCSAEAPGGGGIFAFKIEVKNASIDVRRSFSTSVKGLGGCLFVSNSLFVRGGSVHLAHCEAFSAAGLRAGGSLMLLNRRHDGSHSNYA